MQAGEPEDSDPAACKKTVNKEGRPSTDLAKGTSFFGYVSYTE